MRYQESSDPDHPAHLNTYRSPLSANYYIGQLSFVQKATLSKFKVDFAVNGD